MKSQYNYVWIFAFADLAFLLLIAFTQVSTGNADLCYEMRVPRVVGDVDSRPIRGSVEYHELRVLNPSEGRTGPFQLVHVKDGKKETSVPLGQEELRSRLRELKAAGGKRPVLSADENSLSRDAFMALSLIESEWKARMVGVIPGFK